MLYGQKTAIWTAAMEMLSQGMGKNGCRKPAIVADSAYVILSKNSRDYTGNFAIDEDILREEGVSNFDNYAYDPKGKLMPDFYVGEWSPIFKQKKLSKI